MSPSGDRKDRAHHGHLGLMAGGLNGKWCRLSDSSPLTGGSACSIPSHPVSPMVPLQLCDASWG